MRARCATRASRHRRNQRRAARATWGVRCTCPTSSTRRRSSRRCNRRSGCATSVSWAPSAVGASGSSQPSMARITSSSLITCPKCTTSRRGSTRTPRCERCSRGHATRSSRPATRTSARISTSLCTPGRLYSSPRPCRRRCGSPAGALSPSSRGRRPTDPSTASRATGRCMRRWTGTTRIWRGLSTIGGRSCGGRRSSARS
mmetsp:Transcript_7528/g.19771  ORF Transcript_7528/g.19771 Transcript_7528/m.19771 type:complete len:201 (-) Transcript_7528:215-817(-)